MTEQTGAPAGSAIRRLPRLLALAGVGLFVGLLAYGLLTESSSTSIDESLAEGEAPPAPSFELEVLARGTLPGRLGAAERAMADGSLALAELEGMPAMINLWASWCTPCREEAPRLQRGWERLGRSGVLFLGLNMQDLTADARAFADEFGFSFPQIRDPSNDVARSYGATGIPETYFISARGRVVSHVIGVMSEEQLRAGVTAAKRGVVAGTRTGGDIRPQR
jgi:cytochrome c biogenesis protein CcmG/thiol:disulfide interchange protein DsbE